MKQVTINKCTQCKHFNFKGMWPVCFGLGFRAVLPSQYYLIQQERYVRPTGVIPTWCSLKEAE